MLEIQLEKLLYRKKPNGATHVVGDYLHQSYWKLTDKFNEKTGNAYLWYDRMEQCWVPERITTECFRSLDDIKLIISAHEPAFFEERSLGNDNTLPSPDTMHEVSEPRCTIDTISGYHYPNQLCKELMLAVRGTFRSGSSEEQGLFVQQINNQFDGSGHRIYMRSGEFKAGILLRYCPFCGGHLMSEEEKRAYGDIAMQSLGKN